MQNRSILSPWTNLKPWQKTMLGLIAGVIVGFAIGPRASYLKPIGDVFINAIHMMIAPLVFTSIVCAITSVDDHKKMKRLGLKTITVYVICMCIAAIFGITVANYVSPGTGLHLPLNTVPHPTTSMMEMIINMVPPNPVASFADGNVLQILVFSLVLGLAINMAGEKAKPVINLFQSFSTVVFKLAAIIMSFAPYGIFALMAWVAGEFGLHGLIPLMKLIGTIFICYILQIVVVYMGGLAFICRLSPIKYIKGIMEAMVFAFSCSSSGATLPITMRCAEENLGISKNLSRFLLPLGCPLNMNGMSMYLGAAAVFAANIYGVHLDFMQYVTIIITIVLTSMGAGGVPGSAIIVMGAVMTSVGLPLGAVAIIAGIDRILDMGCTTTNLMGDVFAAVVIAQSEGELDEAIYNREDVQPATNSVAANAA